jgi:hypothetical protein
MARQTEERALRSVWPLKMCSHCLVGPQTFAPARHAACLKSPICASNARLKAGRAVQRST